MLHLTLLALLLLVWCWQAGSLESLHAEQQLLQERLVETAELRVKVSKMQEVVADLPALREELQQLQAVHDATLQQTHQLQSKASTGSLAGSCLWQTLYGVLRMVLSTEGCSWPLSVISIHAKYQASMLSASTVLVWQQASTGTRCTMHFCSS